MGHTDCVAVTSRSLVNIPDKFLGKDFTFFVGESRFSCKEVIALFLSPKLAQMKEIDPTISSFTIKCPNNTGEWKRCFTKIMKSVMSGRLEFEEDEEEIVNEILIQLGNEEIFDSVIEQEGLNTKNAVTFLHKGIESKNVIDFIAEHFESIEDKEQMSIDELEQVILSPNFSVRDESCLFNEICRQIEFDDDKRDLLRFVNLRFLQTRDIEKFISLVDLEDMNADIWSQITQRLVTSPKKEKPNETSIFKKLSKKHGGLREAVSVTCSSVGGGCPEDILVKSNAYCYTKDIENQFFEFDFKSNQVLVSRYELTTPNCGNDGNYPKSWSLEGSNDRENWEIIDIRKNDVSLHGPKKTSSFIIENNDEIFFRYIKIKQQGEGHALKPNYMLILSQIEFYGQILC